jgi:hypothetical protein
MILSVIPDWARSLSADLFDDPIAHGKKNIVYVVRLKANY